MAFGFTTDENNVFGQSVQEAGTYNVKILPQSEVKTSSNGNEMAVFDYEVVDGVYAGGQVRYDNMVWKDDTQEAAERSQKNFNNMAVAAGAKSGVSFTSIQQFVQTLVGKTINIKVEWETSNYNGKTNLVVKAKNKVDQEGSKPNGITRDQVANGSKQQTNASPFVGNQQAQQGDLNPFGGNGGVDINPDDLPF